MQPHQNYRLGLVSTGRIKRMPGIKVSVAAKRVQKARDFANRRGYYMPVVLADSDGCMTLLTGAATFKACLEEKRSKIPAVIVQTAGGADDLMFALQSTEIHDTPDAISVSAVIVQLIDTYGMPRKHIAESLGKSAAWINKMEGLSRKLNKTVQELVIQGHVSARAAQEIARLPDDVQTPFAISAGNAYLSKENIAYLVNRYLNEDTDTHERNRIIQTPQLALPDAAKKHPRMSRDNSDSARLTRAFARCLDDASYLSRLLELIAPQDTVIRITDVIALADSLALLILQLQTVFDPGKTVGLGGHK